MKTLDTPLAVLCYHNDVMMVDANPVDMELEGFRDLLSTAIELAERKPYYCIVDLRKLNYAAPETRSCYAEKFFLEYRIADALVVNSLPLRLLANFYIRVNKPAIPTRMFNDVDKAKEWIEGLKKIKQINYESVNSHQS